MVKVTAPLMSFGASGQLGGAIVFAKTKGTAYVRQYVVPANPQTAKQMSTRAMMKFLSQIWKTIGATAQASWVALSSAQQNSPFNAFTGRNMLLMGEGGAPSTNVAHLASDVLPTLGAQTATGNIGYVSISQAVTAIQGGWAFNIYRSTTIGFTPGPSNIAAVGVFNVNATIVVEDKNLAPATYYYRIIPFTKEGKLGTAGLEMNAVVT